MIRSMNLHRLAEERSLALHRLVAARLLSDPTVLDRARLRVAEWLAAGPVGRHYAEAWQQVLAGDAAAVAAFIVRDDEEARAMRQATPFAGVIDPRTRWRVWREVREQVRR
jgi:hypothetical protein